jgi:AraC family transcriptional regulator of adaptative response / DNA-3-methyladenine glycosylase II
MEPAPCHAPQSRFDCVSEIGEPNTREATRFKTMENQYEGPWALGVELTPELCQRIVEARDPRFDGVFFVAITTTRVYCRTVCPARVVHPERRRFFGSAAAAERAGYRPCLRCRPELAPGRALCDAVPRLASAAALRIAAGSLNGRSVAELARDLCVSERHLRRAMERELGVSPVELAQTHRLLLAKQLLADTELSITRIAYASGFQSLRRFNTVFRERYRLPPNALRHQYRPVRQHRAIEQGDALHLTLSYRAPLAWTALLAYLRAEAMPGIEVVEDQRYGRTVSLNGVAGVVFAEASPETKRRRVARANQGGGRRETHLRITLSAALLPVLMPLFSKLRQLFDLDAEPSVIDAHLARARLGSHVQLEPGIRVPGALDGFETAVRLLLGLNAAATPSAHPHAGRFVHVFGEPIDTGFPNLTRLSPGADRIASAGAERIMAVGLSLHRATAICKLARLVADGALRLEPGADVSATQSMLQDDVGLDPRIATMIVMRALHWPDAFPAADRTLQHAAGSVDEAGLIAAAEVWRPWRAYAAIRLWDGGREEADSAHGGRDCGAVTSDL